MSGESKIDLVNRFFAGTGATYDAIVNLCTFGLDRSWKEKILAKIPEGSARIMDQACGTGILTFQIAQRFPRCRVIGVELREEYLNIAMEKARDLKVNNVEFLLGRAEDVFIEESLDCITSSYLAKYAELGSLVRNMKKMLRKGGVAIVHDFTYPPGNLLPRAWLFYLELLQEFGSWKYPQWRAAFYGLAGLLRHTNWVTELVNSLHENSFTDIHLQPLTWGTSTIVTARKA